MPDEKRLISDISDLLGLYWGSSEKDNTTLCFEATNDLYLEKGYVSVKIGTRLGDSVMRNYNVEDYGYSTFNNIVSVIGDYLIELGLQSKPDVFR